MARYSDLVPVEVAVERFKRTPGNYMMFFADGSAYTGRQGSTTNRIRDAWKKWPDAVAVRFMRDTQNDECVRASREESAIYDLQVSGFRLRNRMNAAIPYHCFLR